MENNRNEQGNFSYTYSAREQAELKKIREKYTPSTKEEDKLARLRRLDASVTQAAQTVAILLGVIGTLILGAGMSLCLVEFESFLGVQKEVAMAIGIGIGVVGGVLASLAYPVYNAVVKHRRKKLAPEIIRLADELLK